MLEIKYDHTYLKKIRESKKISALSIANDITVSERQINSIENNTLTSFASATIKFNVLKKYIRALHLKPEDVIENFEEVSRSFSSKSEFKKIENELEDEPFFGSMKKEFKQLPIVKKKEYIRNFLAILFLALIVNECFSNEFLSSISSNFYERVINIINELSLIINQFPKNIMKYGQ